LGEKELIESIDNAVEFIKNDNSMVRLISHLDCDGICACSLIIKALATDNKQYSVSIVPHLDEHAIRQFASEHYELFIFSDLGSGQLDMLKKHMRDKKILVLDHHKPKNIETWNNIVHINPHLFGINGSKEISGAGVAYYFSMRMNKEHRSLAHLALIGAIGDNQESNGFVGANSKILKIAEESGTVEVSKGLRMFGATTKPLYRVLEYSFDPFIPGVTGSDSGALRFLKEMDINPKIGKAWKRMAHLTEDEMKRMTKGIIEKRAEEKQPEDIFGQVYTLTQEKRGPFRDAREYSTMLNACGRLGKASLGISACLGDQKMQDKAASVLMEYRREIISALIWFQENTGSPNVISGKEYLIINAKDNILPTMIGTIASILARSNATKAGTLIVAMGRTESEKNKVSVRMAGTVPKHMDLRKLISEIVRSIGGDAGGHRNAAGAIIDSRKEQKFIEQAERVLGKYSMAEVI